jgi:alkyl sulfatase BDS1-like metallo-beta-lactamase superfamily hydrolase
VRWLTVVLLATVALAIGGVQVLDRSEAAVEASVRRYAAAVSAADLPAAMAEIAPDQRARWTEWVRGQLGNVYDVRGVAVRSPSVWQRLVDHGPGGPFEVTTVMDVNRDYPADFYQPTTRVPVEDVDGRPYLSVPLLASE